MTTETTSWPVYEYAVDAGNKKVKAEFAFNGTGDSALPFIRLGLGDGATATSGIAKFDKYNGGLKLSYGSSNYGFERSIDLRDDGVVVTNDKGKFSAKSKDFEFIVKEGSYNIGLTNGTVFEVSPSGVNMDIKGDINIKATGNIIINGQTIKLN